MAEFQRVLDQISNDCMIGRWNNSRRITKVNNNPYELVTIIKMIIYKYNTNRYSDSRLKLGRLPNSVGSCPDILFSATTKF